MSKLAPGVLAFLVVVLSLVLVARSPTWGGPSVSMTVRGFRADQSGAVNDNSYRARQYVYVIVDFTVAGGSPVSYLGAMSSNDPSYALLYSTPTGCKTQELASDCGLSSRQFTLAPSQAITFEALVDDTNPCKIALNYSDSRTNRMWQCLPQWIVRRLPWAKSERIAMTGEINLANRRQ